MAKIKSAINVTTGAAADKEMRAMERAAGQKPARVSTPLKGKPSMGGKGWKHTA